MPVYTYRSRHFPVDAQIVGEELERLSAAHAGLTAALVVRAAESQDNPLHNNFTWDNEVAGPRLREMEARWLIRSVRILEDDSGHTRPVYVNVSRLSLDDGPRSIYRPVVEVVTNPADLSSAVARLTEKLQVAQTALDDLKRAVGQSGERQLAVVAGISEALVTARTLAATL